MVLISNHSYCSAGTGKGFFFLSIVVPHGGVCAKKTVLVLLQVSTVNEI